LAVAGLVAILTAAAGALLTDLGPWYEALRQPPWKPPDAWFGPAWTLIFSFTALAAAKAWSAAPTARWRAIVVAAFSLNVLLQVVWSGLFFHWQRPDWALLEVFLLWGSIVLLIWLSYRLTGRAAALLLPYLVWVTFAAAINSAVVRMNGPF
jgi:translocator protein